MKHILMPCIFIFLLTGCMMEPYEQAFDKNAGPYPEHYLEIITGFLISIWKIRKASKSHGDQTPGKNNRGTPSESISLPKEMRYGEFYHV
ncbi:MAG: hypothetical protein R2860_02005 [Desulfobacterales bacterium]